MSLQQKVDFRDLDPLSHQIHGKADIDKVQELISNLRNEIVSQVSQIKKDVNSKKNKKDDESTQKS